MVALQLLELRLALLARTTLNNVLVAQNLVAQELAAMKTVALSIQSTTNGVSFNVPKGAEEHRKAAVGRQTPNRIQELEEDSDESSYETIPIASGYRQSQRSLGTQVQFERSSLLRNMSISGAISSYWDEHQSTYNISLKSRLPRLFGNRAMTLELKIRHYAMCWSSLSLMHNLIAVNNIISKDSEIMAACGEGDESWVRNIFRHRRASPNDLVIDIEPREWWGRWKPNSPLLAAIGSGNCKLVRYLVDCGADVNSINNPNHESPLLIACRKRQLNISRFLVSRGASLEHVDAFGNSAAHCLGHGSWPIGSDIQCFIKFLLSNSFFDFGAVNASLYSPFHMIAENCTVDVAQLLLNYGAELHARTLAGYVPLHWAAHGGNLALVRFILDCGSEVSSQNIHGFTPLHNAAFMRKEAVCILLLEHGADVNAKDYAGVTPLHLTASTCFSRTVLEMFLGHGADPHNVGITDPYIQRERGLAASMETPAGFAKLGGLESQATFLKVLHEYFPEIIVDEEGDVFWNAQEDGGPGYGCSYESVVLTEGLYCTPRRMVEMNTDG
ncbi:MAG: hypothetical protein M1830_009932 [Pleopsidium flavum]|nr:MAG: hypothetical protein M1830_009932 [Pleopsidium flavum]